jgi:small subunit ribosomal protein S2
MVETGETEQMIKKEGLKVKRELAKLERNLGGIRSLERAPDAIFVIDTKKEHIAVTEANRLGIPVIAVVDTNCDPDIIDFVIPGNDDAIRSANLMCRIVADAIVEGKWLRQRKQARNAPAADSKPAAPPPPAAPKLTPEERAAKDAVQQEARNLAAQQQREREERLAAAKAAAPAEPAVTEPAADESAAAAVTDAPATEPAVAAEAESDG